MPLFSSMILKDGSKSYSYDEKNETLTVTSEVNLDAKKPPVQPAMQPSQFSNHIATINRQACELCQNAKSELKLYFEEVDFGMQYGYCDNAAKVLLKAITAIHSLQIITVQGIGSVSTNSVDQAKIRGVLTCLSEREMLHNFAKRLKSNLTSLGHRKESAAVTDAKNTLDKFFTCLNSSLAIDPDSKIECKATAENSSSAERAGTGAAAATAKARNIQEVTVQVSAIITVGLIPNPKQPAKVIDVSTTVNAVTLTQN